MSLFGGDKRHFQGGDFRSLYFCVNRDVRLQGEVLVVLLCRPAGDRVCGSIYKFSWDRYYFGAYKLRLRAREGNLAAIDLQDMRRELFCVLI